MNQFFCLGTIFEINITFSVSRISLNYYSYRSTNLPTFWRKKNLDQQTRIQ